MLFLYRRTPARHVLRPHVVASLCGRSPSGFFRCLPRLGATCGSTWLRCASAAFWLLSSCCGCTCGTGRRGVTRRTTTSRRCSSRRRAQSLTVRRSDGSITVCYGSQCYDPEHLQGHVEQIEVHSALVDAQGTSVRSKCCWCTPCRCPSL